MNKIFLITLFLCSSFKDTVFAQTDALKVNIEQILQTKKATVGLAVYGLEDKDTLSIHNTTHFPMQSVFKFHIALAVLNEVDKGRFSLTQNIFIKKSDLLPDTWSPLRDDYPNGDVNVSLDKILGYTVSQSDNNGCDILLRLIGGEKVANRYLHSIGIKDVAIVANEEAMHKDWAVQFLNWTTPQATIALLKKFYERKILSQKSHDFLWKIMVETSTGKNRIKAQLPPGTIVAHKTGTSGTNQAGITSAINDIGIVTLPNGKHFAICFYVANSKENEQTNEKIIADISKLVWDYYINKSKK